MARTTRLTVTIKPELKAITDEIARANKTSRSKIVSQCLEQLARNHTEKLMIEYYKVMDKEHKEAGKKSVSVIQKIASTWGD